MPRIQQNYDDADDADDAADDADHDHDDSDDDHDQGAGGSVDGVQVLPVGDRYLGAREAAATTQPKNHRRQ